MSDTAPDANSIPVAVPVHDAPEAQIFEEQPIAVSPGGDAQTPVQAYAAEQGSFLEAEQPLEPGQVSPQPVLEDTLPMYEEPESTAPLHPDGFDPVMAEAAAAPVQEDPFVAAASMEEEDMSGVRPVPRVSIQAFCETEGVASIINRASNDRRMAKAHVSVHMGGIPAATEFYQSAATPNLIVVETQIRTMDILQQLQGLAEVCDEGSNVMVVGHANDVHIYRELMARGVSEYLVAPITMVELMTIVNDLFVNPESDPLGNTIAFIGAKGGVGSSTIAHNVAFAISSQFSSDVILADLDLPFGTANIDFDQDPAQGIAEAVFSSDRVDDTYLDRLLAKCSEHLSLLAAPSTLDREYDFGPDDFRQLLEVAQRGTPNVVIDMPHVWTGWSRSVLASADRVVITATPDLASLRNTKNLIDTLAELRPNDEPPFIVLNQTNVPKRPEISVDDFMEPLEVDPAAVIQFEPALFGLASNNGQMISEADKKSDVAASLDALAHILTNRKDSADKPTSKKGSSLLSFLKRKKA